MIGRWKDRVAGIVGLGIALLIVARPMPAAAQSEPAEPTPPGVQPPASTRPPGATRPRMAPPGKMTIDAANGAYKFLLKAVVSKDGLVMYDKLGRGGGPWGSVLVSVVQAFEQVQPLADSNQKLALWINAYNANVLKLTLEAKGKPGFVNVEQVPGFFDKQEITVAGEKMTLNQLQKEKIASLGDPRAHAALVSAAMSSPHLLGEPYLPDRINDQLEAQTRRWINDPTRNGVENSALSLSMIFDWFKDDFNSKPFGDRIGFIRTYADPQGPIANLLAANPNPEIHFKPFDWSLNAARETSTTPSAPPKREAIPPQPAPPAPPAESPATPPGGSSP